MARQVQIRRGTATEHESFVGAVAELSFDTTNNTLRVHDGETPGGIALAKQGEGMPANADYVIETQLPVAANDYTWYRKYKSGWVEQGGFIKNLTTSSRMVTLPIVMAGSDYTITLGAYYDNKSATQLGYIRNEPTNTGFFVKATGDDANLVRLYWCVAGIAK